MKLLSMISCIALAALPVAANAAHQTTVNHNGKTVTAHYEPKVVTKLRQGGLGPRAMPYCMYEASVAVERTVNHDGRAIAALGRSIPANAVSKGQANGYCHELTESRKAGFVGGDAALHGIAASVAGNDAVALNHDLDSLRHLASAARL